MQKSASRVVRAERDTSSCGECRRRKQKCNQGQPCSNCARRYPTPLCEYKPKKKEPPKQHDIHAFTIVPTSATVQAQPESSAWPQQPWAADWDETEDPGQSVLWSGVNIVTQYPVSQDRGSSSSPGTSSPPKLAVCPEGCPLHSEEFHKRQRTDTVANGIAALCSSAVVQPMPGDAVSVRGSPGQFDLLFNNIHVLPVKPSAQSAKLIQIFVQHLCRFKGSLDGSPSPGNPYIEYYVPWCVQSHLLCQITMYTAACSLFETEHKNVALAMVLKGEAIRVLNDHLRSENSVSDEAVSGVTQLIIDEWYWGQKEDLQAHLKGLREMIRLRGGFDNLGVKGLIGKMSLICDCTIAISMEALPALQAGFANNGPEFDLHEPAADHVKVSFNTPLVADAPPFSNRFGLHAATASILNDIRFLVDAILTLRPKPSAQELQKLKVTAEWIHDKISKLPDMFPTLGGITEVSISGEGAGMTAGSSKEQSAATVLVDSSLVLASQQPTSEAAPNLPKAIPEQSQSGSQLPNSPAADLPRNSSSDGTTPDPMFAAIPQPDFLYATVRLTAMHLSRAVMNRQPLSTAIQPMEFLILWGMAWSVPLKIWKNLLGIFIWILFVITPTSCQTPQAHYVKSLLQIGSVQMGLENWQLCIDMLRRGIRLQMWLQGGARVKAKTGHKA